MNDYALFWYAWRKKLCRSKFLVLRRSLYIYIRNKFCVWVLCETQFCKMLNDFPAYSEFRWKFENGPMTHKITSNEETFAQSLLYVYKVHTQSLEKYLWQAEVGFSENGLKLVSAFSETSFTISETSFRILKLSSKVVKLFSAVKFPTQHTYTHEHRREPIDRS